MFVGGEFYDDPRWLINQPGISTGSMTFLNGGTACLMVIADYLLDHGMNQILLPSYVCPSVVNTLERSGLACAYYQINSDFSIDIQDLVEKAARYQAVYFINYFGFLHSAETRTCLASLRQKGVLMIEDNAQAAFIAQPSGDFTFNSMRKFSPCDGGYLITPFDVMPYIKKYHTLPNRRLALIRTYRRQLAEYLFQGKHTYNELVQLYQQAEDYYESDIVVEGDDLERQHIEHLDWPEIKRRRRENYAYMLELIRDLPQLTPIFPDLQADGIPLGLPVYVNGVSRDALHDVLGEAGIGLTIHWHEIITDPRLNGNPVALKMADKILTLCIDQNTSHKQMDYQVQEIMRLVKGGV
jgi:dTDP-4-amino-4,6-dideoxygalactose transaminase